MSDPIQEGFRPAFAGLVEFADHEDGSAAWRLDDHSTHARTDADHGDFTGRTAMVFEQFGCFGIWFESVRVQYRRVVISDWSSKSFESTLLDEPALVAAIRTEPTGDLLRPRWELSGWILLDLFGLVSVGVWCRSMVSVVQRLLHRSRPSHCCQSCGYDLAGLATSNCPECGTAGLPAADNPVDAR